MTYIITSVVRNGGAVRITGFGTFKPRYRQARHGQDTQSGSLAQIKASKGIAFSAAPMFKRNLNSRGPIAVPMYQNASAPASDAKASPVRRALRAKKASLMRPAQIAATKVTRTSRASHYELPSSLPGRICPRCHQSHCRCPGGRKSGKAWRATETIGRSAMSIHHRTTNQGGWRTATRAITLEEYKQPKRKRRTRQAGRAAEDSAARPTARRR